MALSTLRALSLVVGIAHAAILSPRDSTVSSSVTDSSLNGGLGSVGQLTTVNSGVIYWINGGSTHNFYGNINNFGSIYVSQTNFLKSFPYAGGQTSDWVGHTSTDGNLNNAAGASIQLNDIGSASAPTYDWYLNRMTNAGTIQWCGRGDTGGSTFQMYSDTDSINTGLISFEQSLGNLGASYVWRNSDLSSTTANLYNNGAFRLVNVVYHNVQNVYGTGCWQIGSGAVLYLEDGSGVYKNPSNGPTFPQQSISFTDPSATLHMDTAVYSKNSNFGPTIYGFGTGNAIEFYETIRSFAYTASTGLLTVTMTSNNVVNIKLGSGYSTSSFRQARNPQKYNTLGYNAIFYDGSAPNTAAPSTCGLSAPICKNLGQYPPSSAPATTTTTTLPAASPGYTSTVGNTVIIGQPATTTIVTSLPAASPGYTSTIGNTVIVGQPSSTTITTSLPAASPGYTSTIGNTVIVGQPSPILSTATIITSLPAGSPGYTSTRSGTVIIGQPSAFPTTTITTSLPAGASGYTSTTGNTVVVGQPSAFPTTTITTSLPAGASGYTSTTGNTVVVGQPSAFTTTTITTSLPAGASGYTSTTGNTVVVGQPSALPTTITTSLPAGASGYTSTIGNTVVVGQPSPILSTATIVTSLPAGSPGYTSTIGNTVVVGQPSALPTTITTSLPAGASGYTSTIGNTVVVGQPSPILSTATIVTSLPAGSPGYTSTIGNTVVVGQPSALPTTITTSLPAGASGYTSTTGNTVVVGQPSAFPTTIITSLPAGASGYTSTTGNTVVVGQPSAFPTTITTSLPAAASGYTSTRSGTVIVGQPSSVTTTSTTAPAPSYTGTCIFQGCYSEAVNTRALNDYNRLVDPNMTVEMCQSYCAGFSAPLFGVEYGTECYCGLKLQYGSVLTPVSDCNFACPGNSLEFCGAGNRLDVYACNGASASGVPTTTAPICYPSPTATVTSAVTVYVTMT